MTEGEISRKGVSKVSKPWMYGNIKVVELAVDAGGSSRITDEAGDVFVDLFRGVAVPFFDRIESIEFREDEGGIGGSDIIDSRVSAPTMPPIEWPIRMTRTEGSIVGEGVAAETSRSMTLFWSLSRVVNQAGPASIETW